MWYDHCLGRIQMYIGVHLFQNDIMVYLFRIELLKTLTIISNIFIHGNENNFVQDSFVCNAKQPAAAEITKIAMQH